LPYLRWLSFYYFRAIFNHFIVIASPSLQAQSALSGTEQKENWSAAEINGIKGNFLRLQQSVVL
jgi:hypothetical protein